MGDAVIQHPDGYHAFLLVVRYGGRFTKEDRCVINTLKSIFGEEIISQFSIILMTHGDLFHTQNETKKCFEQWCSEQTDDMKELMEECGNRVILFDNRTNDQVKLDSQMNTLIQTVDNLQSRGMRYNHEYFQRAVKNREHLLVAVKEPRILEETNKECSIIYHEMEKIDSDFSDDCIKKLNCLHQRALTIKSMVLREDNKTGALIKVLELIDSSCRMITNRLQVINALRLKELDIKEERANILKLHDERMNNLIESYEEKRAQDAHRLETERKEIEAKWLEQEEKMQDNLKRTLNSVESEKNAYQRRMEELERECQEAKAEAKSQVEEKIAILQSSMNELLERESKEKHALQEELIRMRNLQQEEQKKYNEKVEEELKKVSKNFIKKQRNFIDQHKEEIDILKEKEETLIKEMKKINDDLQKEKDANVELRKELSDLQNLYDKEKVSVGKIMKNICPLM